MDADPYGLKILSVYMSGSKNMSYDSASLTTPDIKWLGVRPSDLDRYNIPEQCRLDMTEHDIATGRQMLNEPFIQQNPEWSVVHCFVSLPSFFLLLSIVSVLVFSDLLCSSTFEGMLSWS